MQKNPKWINDRLSFSHFHSIETLKCLAEIIFDLLNKYLVRVCVFCIQNTLRSCGGSLIDGLNIVIHHVCTVSDTVSCEHRQVRRVDV